MNRGRGPIGPGALYHNNLSLIKSWPLRFLTIIFDLRNIPRTYPTTYSHQSGLGHKQVDTNGTITRSDDGDDGRLGRHAVHGRLQQSVVSDIRHGRGLRIRLQANVPAHGDADTAHVIMDVENGVPKGRRRLL